MGGDNYKTSTQEGYDCEILKQITQKDSMKTNEFLKGIYFEQACKQNLKHMKKLMLLKRTMNRIKKKSEPEFTLDEIILGTSLAKTFVCV